MPLKRTLEVLLVVSVAMLLLAPRWLGYLSATSSVNQLDTDFLYFDSIQANPGHFANVLILGVVERVTASFGALIGLSRLLTGMGVEQNHQLIAFFMTQLSLGVAGVWLILTGLRLGCIERLLVFALFAFSFFSQFGRYIGGPGFYNKVTVSCFAIGAGFVIIGLFVRGQHLASMTLSALLAYLHPVYSAVFLALNISFAAKTWREGPGWSKGSIAVFLGTPALILLPLAWGLLESRQVLTGQTGALWWDYLKAKTSNPFPLQDGLVIVLPSLALFAITFHLLGRLARQEASAAYLRAQWVVGAVIAAWIVQIVFTELVPVSFVARLSLTRMTPFALLFMVVAYVRIAWRHRDRDETGLWLVLLLVPAVLGPAQTQMFSGEVIRQLLGSVPWVLIVLGGWWPDFTIFPESLLLFVILLVHARRVGVLGGAEAAAGSRPGLAPALIAAAVALLALLVAMEASRLVTEPGIRGASTVAAGTILLMWMAEQQFGTLSAWRRAAGWARTRSALVGGLLVLAVAAPMGVAAAKRIATAAPPPAEADLVWDFLERNTKANEMVLVVPLFETRRFPVMPLRPIFVDWSDSQYVLYDPAMLEPLMQRLTLMGMDVDRALKASNCAGVLQYVDAMCKRKLFETLSRDYSDAWRRNLPKIREIAPNLSYVLLRSRHVVPEDRVVFRTGEVALVKL